MDHVGMPLARMILQSSLYWNSVSALLIDDTTHRNSRARRLFHLWFIELYKYILPFLVIGKIKFSRIFCDYVWIEIQITEHTYTVFQKNPCDYIFDDNLNSKRPIVIIIATVIT